MRKIRCAGMRKPLGRKEDRHMNECAVMQEFKVAQSKLDKVMEWVKAQTAPIPYGEKNNPKKVKVTFQGQDFYYPSIRETARYINVPESSIRYALSKQNTYYRNGCLISYVDEGEEV